MNYLGGILVIVCSFFFRVDNNTISSEKVNLSAVGDSIIWSPTYKLTVEDFTGTYVPLTSDPAKNRDTAGCIQVGIGYNLKVVNNRLNIDAYAYMIKNKSFLKIPNKDVLRHEQAHFDIAEIYALKLTRIVNEKELACPFPSSDCFFDLVESTYKQTIVELERRQNDFDLSYYGDLSKMLYYNQIRQELKQLLDESKN